MNYEGNLQRWLIRFSQSEKNCLQEIRLQTQSIAANFSFLLCLGSRRLLLHKIFNQSYTMTLNELN